MTDIQTPARWHLWTVLLLFLAALTGSLLMTTLAVITEKSTSALAAEVTNAALKTEFEDLSRQKIALLAMAAVVNIVIVVVVAVVEALTWNRAANGTRAALERVAKGDYTGGPQGPEAPRRAADAAFKRMEAALRDRTVNDLARVEKIQAALEDMHAGMQRHSLSKDELAASLKEASRTASGLRADISDRLGRHEEGSRLVVL
jgi:hypothetical protein